MSDVRAAAVAGSWYPSAPDRLRLEIDRYLENAHVEAVPPPRALIAPHAGLMYSGPVAAFAYKAAARVPYAAVVLVGPSHFVRFEGVSVWPRGAWLTPFGSVPIAEELAARIRHVGGDVIEHPAAHGREHSLELQLPFIASVLPGVPVVPLVMGSQTRTAAFALGDALARSILELEADADRFPSAAAGRVLLVASSDLSHYFDSATAAAMDAVVLRHVSARDARGLMNALEQEPHHACGGGAIVAVMQAADRLGAVHARVLTYADSGDITGDKSAVVGYMAAALW